MASDQVWTSCDVMDSKELREFNQWLKKNIPFYVKAYRSRMNIMIAADANNSQAILTPYQGAISQAIGREVSGAMNPKFLEIHPQRQAA